MDVTSVLWSYCHILRHDGVDYSDYIEQLTYLLFLKMADENGISVPKDCQWSSLLAKEGVELSEHYQYILERLKEENGILGQIFQEPISKIKNPKNLKKIIVGIESIGWTKLDKDVQGEAFEGLLERTANEGKKGAGQFFTPRPLIRAIVNVMQPNPLEKKGFRLSDTSCGTGGFLTMAAEWGKKRVSPSEWKTISNSAYHGQELVVRPYRLALMNLFLHGVNPQLLLGDSIYSFEEKKNRYDCILTNPPFGTRGSSGPPLQRDFFIQTSNIQINFIQHIYEVLKPNGRAAIVLPDSILTDYKARELWEILIGEDRCNVHTILRLPNGTFTPYANGVKACVIFFQKAQPTQEIWVYDARTNEEEITKTSRPLNYEKHFKNFVSCYGSHPNGRGKRKESGRFQRYSLEQIKDRNYDLSFMKLQQPAKLENPSYYIDKLILNFETQLASLHKIKGIIEANNKNV